MYKMMTPGPTQVKENVRLARARECGNPDIDEEFFDFYKETCELISSLLHTENETLILSGEGILGLEAACASLTEPGDKALVLDNGIFGEGFADFVSLYGGEPQLYTVDGKNPIDAQELEEFLTVFKFLLRERPPFVVSPYVKKLNDNVYNNAYSHQPRSIGKYGADAGRGKIIFIGDIEHPGLADCNKAYRGCNPEPHCRLSRFFAVKFAQDIGHKEGGGKKDIP